MIRKLITAAIGGTLLATGMAMTASAQSGVGGGVGPGSAMVPFSETEFRNQQRFGINADEDWRSQRDFYTREYRPGYYFYRDRGSYDDYDTIRGYRHHSRRPVIDSSDRWPATAREYHDYYDYDARTNRVRTPSYYYPSTGTDARLYRSYHWR